MSRYCLDTSAYSHFKRGEPRVTALIDAADWLGIPTITLGELWIGFLKGTRLEQNELELREFLADPMVEELTPDHDTSRIFAEIFLDLRRAGKPVPINDVWIAACAARAGATLLTYDDHFRAMGRVGSVVLPQPS